MGPRLVGGRPKKQALVGRTSRPLALPARPDSESFWGPEITAAIEAERERDRQLAETQKLRDEQLAKKKAAQRERLEALRRQKAEDDQ